MTVRCCAAPGCEKLLHRKQLRYCSRGCAGAARGYPPVALVLPQREDEFVVHFPEVTGEVVAEFWRHNHDPGDKRGSIPLRPATHVQTQSGIA